MSTPDRREASRIPARLRVTYRPIDAAAGLPKETAAETLNMSASGLCLLSPNAVAADAHLALELALEGHDEAVMAIGRVVWCDRDAANYRVGICFTWLRDEDRAPLQAIADYVQARAGS